MRTSCSIVMRESEILTQLGMKDGMSRPSITEIIHECVPVSHIEIRSFPIKRGPRLPSHAYAAIQVSASTDLHQSGRQAFNGSLFTLSVQCTPQSLWSVHRQRHGGRNGQSKSTSLRYASRDSDHFLSPRHGVPSQRPGLRYT